MEDYCSSYTKGAWPQTSGNFHVVLMPQHWSYKDNNRKYRKMEGICWNCQGESVQRKRPANKSHKSEWREQCRHLIHLPRHHPAMITWPPMSWKSPQGAVIANKDGNNEVILPTRFYYLRLLPKVRYWMSCPAQFPVIQTMGSLPLPLGSSWQSSGCYDWECFLEGQPNFLIV